MMQEKREDTNRNLDAGYCEESARLPILILVVALVLVAVPLVWMILKIDVAGAKAADIPKYNALIQTVGTDVEEIKAMLASGSEGVDVADRVVTLIVPELVLVEDASADNSVSPLKIQLKGIYWNPTRPLVDIDNETYYVGDMVQGYEIVEIGKTTVRFKAKDGTIVVKDFYETLFQNNQ